MSLRLGVLVGMMFMGSGRGGCARGLGGFRGSPRKCSRMDAHGVTLQGCKGGLGFRPLDRSFMRLPGLRVYWL